MNILDLTYQRDQLDWDNDGFHAFTKDPENKGEYREWCVPSRIKSAPQARRWIRSEIEREKYLKPNN